MTIHVVGDQIPSVPTDFQRRLSKFDSDLYVVWHKSPFTRQPGRWKIERCIKHNGRFENGLPVHDHICVRTYIVMCQDEEGDPVPLGEWVFEKLREMRQNWERLGGDSERGIQNAVAHSDAIQESLDQKREAARDDMIEYNRKDKRVQINRLYDLIERHDMRPNR